MIPFIGIAWVATSVAHKSLSMPAQYAALGGYILAESIIFVPLLYIAQANFPGAIESAALVTLVGFTGLTAIAIMSKKDFSTFE